MVQVAEAVSAPRQRAEDRTANGSRDASRTQVFRLCRALARVLRARGCKPLRHYLGKLAINYAIFVCQNAEERCPTLWPSALVRLSWPFADPTAAVGSEEERLAGFRAVRDQIDARIAAWLIELGIDNRPGTPQRERTFG